MDNAMDAQVTRYSWLLSKLDKEDGVLLSMEATHFTNLYQALVAKPLDESATIGQRGAYEYLQEQIAYCLACMNEVTQFGTVSSELTRVFSWHKTLLGEKFWVATQHKYAEREFAAKRARLQAIQDQAVEEIAANKAKVLADAEAQIQKDREFEAQQAAAHEILTRTDPDEFKESPEAPEVLPVQQPND